MMHWTVTDTLKLSDAGEFHTIFSRGKVHFMACRIQYALPTTPNCPLKCTHGDVLHHNPTVMCLCSTAVHQIGDSQQ